MPKKKGPRTSLHIYTEGAIIQPAVRPKPKGMLGALKKRWPFKTGTEEALSQQQQLRSYSSTQTILFDGDIADSELLYGAKREPVANRIVVGVAEDIFNKWFKIENIDKPDDIDLDKQVQTELERLEAKQHLTRLAILERLYGWSVLVLGYQDSAEDLQTPVSNPSSLDSLQVYSKPDVSKIEENDDAESENYLYPEYVTLNISQGSKRIHLTRFLWTSTRLVDHRYLGVSALENVYDDINALRRMRWSLAMTMIRHGSGFPDVKLIGASIADVDAFIASGQFDNLNAMRYFVHNDQQELNFKGAEGSVLNPSVYVLPIFESISAGTRIPVAILRGAQAGALTGSEVNEREYAQLISSIQSQYERTVKQLVTAIMNVRKLKGNFKIAWNSIIELDEKTQADIDNVKERTNVLKTNYMTINEVRQGTLGEGKDIAEGNVVLSLVKGQANMPQGSPQGSFPGASDQAESISLQKQLESSLKQLLDDVRNGKLTTDQALMAADLRIEEHISSMRKIVQTNLERKLGRPVGDLSPEAQRQFVTMKKGYLSDFKRILQDAGF